MRILQIFFDLPRQLLMALLKGYRLVISPLYGQVCRYYPSCSAYALEAVTVHGVVKGIWLSTRRLVRCHPFTPGGVDHVPAGTRKWPYDKLPRILVLNHAVVDDYIDGPRVAKEQ